MNMTPVLKVLASGKIQTGCVHIVGDDVANCGTKVADNWIHTESAPTCKACCGRSYGWNVLTKTRRRP